MIYISLRTDFLRYLTVYCSTTVLEHGHFSAYYTGQITILAAVTYIRFLTRKTQTGRVYSTVRDELLWKKKRE